MQQLDLAKLGSYLEKNVHEFSGPITAEKFSGGQSNPTYLIKSPSGQYVLRRQPFGNLLKSAHAVDREFRIQKALQGTGVPIASMYHLCEDTSVIGSMFYLMEYIDGQIFWAPGLPEVSKQERSTYYQECIRILAALHNVNLKDHDLLDYGKHGNYFERQFNIWNKQYRASETNSIPSMEQLIDWIQHHFPGGDYANTLVHGDFRFDNIIFSKTKPLGLALIDWELSTVGHPLADIAFFCMCLRLPDNKIFNGLAGHNREDLGVPAEEDIVKQYCQLRGIEHIAHWNFYLAFSLFRLAAILQGVLKRALDGNASNEKAKYLGAMVEPLSVMAMELAMTNKD